MNIKLIRYTSLVLFLVAFVASGILAKGEGDQKKASSLHKTLGTPVYTKMNINNISTWIKNDGESDINQNGNSGFTYPKGSNKQCVFQSGFLWGGKVDDQVRVGGSVYRQGTVPGRIKPDGTPADPDDADVRIYRVRKDYADGDLSAELADGDGASVDEIRAQYETDWNEWPASQGAPFEDNNGNGTYEPSIDVPGVPDADQTVWFVANDFDPAQTDFMYGSLPMGIEEQVTVWGYKSTTALGNMIFRKYLIINKNPDQKAFTDMYVSMWTDSDNGDAGDDFNGSDVDLSLSYTYNANAVDATYGNTPPASGFDFFQGPIVDGEATDVAIFKGKYVEGKKNLPMTAHYFFIRGDATWGDPPQGVYQGTLEWYNLFQGKVGRTGDEFPDPTTGGTTKFALSGDPVAGTGWIDGMLHPPGDRRNGMASGPFNMAYGDTQEIVVAEIAAGATEGIDRLGAVAVLKFYDKQAQVVYDNFFNVPLPPPAPKVTASAFDQAAVLSWGSDAAAIEATETSVSGAYTFQGYNVYQLPAANALLSQGKRVATFDIVDGVLKVEDEEFDASSGVVLRKVKQFGTDSGIKRFVTIESDLFNGGLPLLNGSNYYFAVTAYSYNPDPTASPRQLENALTIHTVRPQKPNPGVRYEADPGDAISATHKTGTSDGAVTAYVVDPSKLTGETYTVTFKDNGHGDGGVLWTLKKGSTVILEDQENLSGDDNYLFIDGLQIKVSGPTPGVKPGFAGDPDEGWNIPSGARKFTWASASGFEFEAFEGALGWASPRYVFGDGLMLVGPGEVKNVLLKLATVADGTAKTNPVFDPNDENVSYGYRYMRGATAAPAKSEFAPYILNPSSGYSFQEYAKNVPFSAWNVDDPANPKRLAVGFLENNAAFAVLDGVYWPAFFGTLDADGQTNTSGSGPREWLFIMDDPYTDATPDPKYQAEIISGVDMRVMYWATWNRRNESAWSATGTGKDQFAIYPNKAITPVDVFEFKAPSVVDDPELAKKDVDDVIVFPNPYYGVNPQELNKYQRFVTFSHLPRKATLRIFNLAGQLVRTIEKEAPEQFQRWDLQNEDELPVASGLYIVHIDMPDLGKTKILKVAVIQEQQILDRF